MPSLLADSVTVLGWGLHHQAPLPLIRERSPEGRQAYLEASSKLSTRSGTSSSSSAPAVGGGAPLPWYVSASFFRLARLSGPSWLMMPGRRSCSFLVSAWPLTTYVLAAMDACTLGLLK